MNRRAVIRLLGGAAVWPLAAHGQDSSETLVAFVHGAPSAGLLHIVEAVREGIEQSSAPGFRFRLETRWAEGSYERLPALAAELIKLRPSVIVAGAGASALAVKATGTAIPVVFTSGSDPVRDGLVSSLARPGGTVTGVTLIATALGPKRLELIHGIVPQASLIGVLFNPNNPSVRSELWDLEGAARTMDVKLLMLEASNAEAIDMAFAVLVKSGAGALMVTVDATFNGHREQIITLAKRHAMPAIYYASEYTTSGGLMSYGSNLSDTYRQVGVYVARILQGAKPADLPVLQPTKLDLVINMRTAKVLGLTVSRLIYGRADMVIE